MGLFDRLKKQKSIDSVNELKKDTSANAEYEPVDDTPKERHLVKETIFLDGIAYYQDNFLKLATINPNWNKVPEEKDKTVYKYKFKNKPVEIDDDPDFKGSLRVKVDGLKIGIVRRDYHDKMLDILNNYEVKYISAFIYGGPFKSYGNGELITDHEENGVISARLSIGYVIKK